MIENLVKQSGLPELQAQVITNAYGLEAIKTEIEKWQGMADSLVVTAEDQTEKMAMAGTARKAMVKIRTGIEKNRKGLKEDALKTGRFIDACAKEVTALVTPLEEHFRTQEEFAKRAQEARTAELVAKRKALLQEADIGSDCFDLGKMSEEEFASLLDTARAAKADREAKVRANEKLMAQRCEALEAEGVNTRFLNVLTMTEEEFQSRLATAKTDRERKEQDRVEHELHWERAGLVIHAGLGETVPFLGKMSVDEFDKFVAAEKQKQEAKAEADRKAAEAKAEADRMRAEAERQRQEQAKKLAEERRIAEEAKAKQQQAEAELLAKKQAEEAEAKRKAEDERKLQEGPEIERVKAFAKTLRAVAESAPVLRAERLTKEVDDAVQAINEAAENLEALCDA